MDREIFLCVPCTIDMTHEGEKLKKTRHCRDKGTCERCKRRRFGDYYIRK